MKRIALVLAVTFGLQFSASAAIKLDAREVFGKGQEALQARDFEKAAKLFSDVIEQAPKFAPGYVLRGLAQASREKLDEAIADFSKAIEITPSDERPYLLRASVYQQKKDYDNAISDYTQALNRNPGDAETLCNRGICYAAKQNGDKALADFDSAVKAEPKNAIGWQLRGSVYSEQGKREEALADFKQAMTLDPNNASTYLYRAQLYLIEKEPELALSDFEEAMRRAPDRSGITNDYAWTLATNPKDSVRDGRKAVEFAKKACHLSDYKHAPTLDTLAAAHAEAGDWTEAVKWQQEALTLAQTSHPDDVDGMKERLDLYKTRKPFREEPKREKKEKP
jgi:tetratricopeptide (TPR) repeat protein